MNGLGALTVVLALFVAGVETGAPVATVATIEAVAVVWHNKTLPADLRQIIEQLTP